MSTILVTGGTGLIGSNICRRLVEEGHEVRALIRPGSASAPLLAIGVTPVAGDLQRVETVRAAADGCEAIVNSAALLGGAVQDDLAHDLTNREGAVGVYDVGRDLGIRVVTLGSTPYLDHSVTLTEDAAVASHWNDDPYTRSKGAAFVEAERRALEGADIITVIPGATFGPGLVLERALGPTSFNRTLRGGLNGRIDRYLSYPAPWVGADDVAAVCVAATLRGRSGRMYLAFGAEDARSTASWLNLGCEIAGMPHRVLDLVIPAVGPVDPDIVMRFGATQVGLARRRFPVPWFDSSATCDELRVRPRRLSEHMEETVHVASGERPAPLTTPQDARCRWPTQRSP